MNKPTHVVLALLALALAWTGLAYSAAKDTAGRGQWNTGEMYSRYNGEHVHRATLTPDNTTAEDNTTAAGGTAVTYTFLAEERVCYEAVGTDVYVEVIAAASMTAAGAKARLVKADQSGDVVCDTFRSENAVKKVSALCTAAGPCILKIFEVR